MQKILLQGYRRFLNQRRKGLKQILTETAIIDIVLLCTIFIITLFLAISFITIRKPILIYSIIGILILVYLIKNLRWKMKRADTKKEIEKFRILCKDTKAWLEKQELVVTKQNIVSIVERLKEETDKKAKKRDSIFKSAATWIFSLFIPSILAIFNEMLSGTQFDLFEVPVTFEVFWSLVIVALLVLGYIKYISNNIIRNKEHEIEDFINTLQGIIDFYCEDGVMYNSVNTEKKTDKGEA